MAVHFKCKNMSSNDSASRFPEFHVMRRNDFESWKIIAIVFNYNTARAIMKFLKEKNEHPR